MGRWQGRGTGGPRFAEGRHHGPPRAGGKPGRRGEGLENLFKRLDKNTDGKIIHSFAATNIRDAYGLGLVLRRDSDGDGWPDAWDHAPNTPGYKDGVKN